MAELGDCKSPNRCDPSIFDEVQNGLNIERAAGKAFWDESRERLFMELVNDLREEKKWLRAHVNRLEEDLESALNPATMRLGGEAD